MTASSSKSFSAKQFRQRYGRITPLQWTVYALVSTLGHVLLGSIFPWFFEFQWMSPSGSTGANPIDLIEVTVPPEALLAQAMEQMPLPPVAAEPSFAEPASSPPDPDRQKTVAQPKPLSAIPPQTLTKPLTPSTPKTLPVQEFPPAAESTDPKPSETKPRFPFSIPKIPIPASIPSTDAKPKESAAAQMPDRPNPDRPNPPPPSNPENRPNSAPEPGSTADSATAPSTSTAPNSAAPGSAANPNSATQDVESQGNQRLPKPGIEGDVDPAPRPSSADETPTEDGAPSQPTSPVVTPDPKPSGAHSSEIETEEPEKTSENNSDNGSGSRSLTVGLSVLESDSWARNRKDIPDQLAAPSLFWKEVPISLDPATSTKCDDLVNRLSLGEFDREAKVVVLITNQGAFDQLVDTLTPPSVSPETQSAVSCLLQDWQFEPALKAGVAVYGTLVLQLNFS